MKSRIRVSMILALAGLTLVAGSAAFAASPKKGATYKGKTTDNYPMGKSESATLKVSKDGKTVNFSSGFSDSCGKRSFSASFPISGGGSFSGDVVLPKKGLQTGTAHVTGQFTAKGKKAKGTIGFTLISNLILFTSTCGTKAAHPLAYNAKR